MNLHKAYYKDYFKGVSNWENPKDRKNATAIRSFNTQITMSRLATPDDNDLGENTKTIDLKIQYPGLVTGIGINHETGVEGEFKLGLHFDWTWGMPVVYGSSIKGVLRAYFKDIYKPKANEPSIAEAFNDIFEGKCGDATKSIYDRDIFFDSFFTKGDKQDRILYSDSITPHGDNPLQEPTPIPFLKVAAGSTLRIRFKLVETIVNGKQLSTSRKLDIFKQILTTIGIGAKTNVGYGQLSDVK